MHKFAFLNPIATRLQVGQVSRRASACSLQRTVGASTFSARGGASGVSSTLGSFVRPFGSGLAATARGMKSESDSAEMRTGPTMVGETGLKHVVIAGGTGFIGSRLAERLIKDGSKVTILSRDVATTKAVRGADVVAWAPDGGDGKSGGWVDALRNADGVVNLCGVPVVSRWTEKGKAAIVNSRVDPTKSLVSAVGGLPEEERPKALVNASGVGFYGTDFEDGQEVDEGYDIGSDYLARICKGWEGAAMAGKGLARVVVIRLGLVVGSGGGALKQMLPAFQLFVGGPLGSGKQWVSWIHVDDVVSIIIRALQEKHGMADAYNCTAPNAVRMQDFCGALAKALGRPNLFAVPEVVLKVALGEASMVLTKGQKAVPKRLQDEGFDFKYDNIEDAMEAVVQEV